MLRWAASALLAAVTSSSASALAQAPSEPGATNNPVAAADAVRPASGPVSLDSNVQQAGCATCGAGLFSGGCSSCGGGGNCYPGRTEECCGLEGNTAIGRFLSGVYQCICCPDPCYEPKWTPVADSAFFVDAARPVTQMRLRWDTGFDLQRPDRAEYFWPRDRTNPMQLGPGGPCGRTGSIGKGPCVATAVDHEDLALYTEAAAGPAGLFIEVPYRHIDPETAPVATSPCCAASGFADMNVGTKAMLLDCQLLQITFQFKTFIPTGDFTKGLGTAHVSLEPSFLFGVCLADDWYFQGQVAYWIPIGGDALYQGNIFHSHVSFNKVLWRPLHNVVIVGTLEANEWSVLGGSYTVTDRLFVSPDPNLNGKPFSLSATATMASAGPGVRMFICDKIDIGVGSAFAFTGDRWEKELIRAEFRWRF